MIQRNKINKSRLTSIFILLGVAAGLLTSNAFAQAYKWIDANGKTVYSDTPPPPSAKKVATKSFDTGSSINTANFPSDLAAAVSKNPVTLYTAPNCGACNEGRSLLKQAGIPFTEKTVKTNDDVNKLSQVSGDTSLPLLIISRSKFKGLDAVEWKTALAAAGYPETNKLPKDYRYPEPEPAAPPVVNENKAADTKAAEPLKPKSSSASGIRF
ncbi:glutaredoxin family protein [Undibacterium cyanobacteriorum]|uniref:Glutaredoxin family protein n=1 Tax=Undibacterium cyanobacteriorum TaxID=3073561 RepID=A0ABY9RPE0_9BURK|nr:glutaredoxin family protein [Undibacterium sp. 20NA77.5]WMW82135.1 glutaredoxin family protein [Undibacterium sp. 20NA77.5]